MREEKNKKKTYQETEAFNDIMTRREKKNYQKMLEEDEKEKEIENTKNIENTTTLEKIESEKCDSKEDNSFNDATLKNATKDNIIKEKLSNEQTPSPIDEIKNLSQEKKENSSKKVGVKIFSILSFILSIAYLIFTILFCQDQVDNLFLIINASIMTIFTLFLMLTLVINKNKAKNVYGIFTSLVISIFFIFNFLVMKNIIEIPTQELLKDFQNQSITEALKWANSHNIEVNQIYEYSDNTPEYYIISQDIYPNTLLKNVDKITFIVSYGPNYDKIISLPNMVGWNIDDAIKTINENFLNNVQIDYELNDDTKKDIILQQSISGQIRRNDEVKLKVSLGRKEDLEPVEMIDLFNKSLMEATIWLKRNGIEYELEYVFSDSISKDYVVSQKQDKGEMIDPKEDKVTLIISKGKKIVIPDLTKMSIDEATEWIINNNLKVKFETKYDSNVEVGKIIGCDYNIDDEVESGTLITIITSKGSLKMRKFNSVSEFRNWANEIGIEYREEYEFNNDVNNGEIIKTIPEENAVINYSDTIVIYISYGKPVEVPYFIGKSRSEIENECNNVGLNCTFYYNDYSDTPYDIAQNQNKNAGSQVVIGTYVSIGLSKGPRPAEKPQTTTPSCDRSITTPKEVWLTAGNNGSQTKANVSGAWPDIKWNFKMVDSCDNGDSGTGTVCNAWEFEGKYLNYCDTYTIIIVN